MFKETNILKSEKSIDLDSNDIIKTMNKHQRSEIKVKLMEKYNLPSDAAERIIDTLEEKNKIKLDTNENLMKDKNNNTHHEIDSNIEKNFFVSKNNLKHTSEETNTKSNNIQKDHMNYDVDSIITGIVPDYKQNISIEVEHVDLTFEVTSEKIDTIKERVIRSLKGKKSEKTKIHALDDISFKIYQGEKVGIIGYNGAGKSTLLNVISGIYPPDTGFVKTSGKISPLLSLGAGFDMNYTGRKNILLNGAILGYEKEFLESKVDEIIEFSELNEFIDIPIKNYSKGMLAKLGFSIATAVNPDILIIDEILGVGDVNFSKKSGDKIKSLMEGGVTVLLVSHSIPQIIEICDKAIWIEHGRIREIGEVNEVCNHYLKVAEKASNKELANIQLR